MQEIRRRLRLGTRRSPMALEQTTRVTSLLTDRYPGLEVEVVPIVASGDRHTGDLAAIGGKGVWVRELDNGLLVGDLDLTVSCAKDCPASHDRPAGITIGAALTRDDARDALVLPAHMSPAKLTDLPAGARIGTSAPRRAAQLRRLRPDLEIVPLRGNLNTRLERIDAELVDAALVAFAGLVRIGHAHRAVQILEPHEICPAAGAGIIVIEHRADNRAAGDLLAGIGDLASAQELAAERAVLAVLEGHCRSPLAAHAVRDETGQLRLHAMAWSFDGAQLLEASGHGDPLRAEDLGVEVAEQLVKLGAHEMIAAIPH